MAIRESGPALNPTRPDPDALIERLRAVEARAARGRLRVYFGASAGVGKSYAMLGAARAVRLAGTDVVAGVIETHGRADTIAQTAGLELLPRREIARPGGPPLGEFDLDGALARRPRLILVDELAHSNLAGSRHPKRWQDVEELLAAGIDVWTTLNVQHLESLNDVVGGITGIRVQETLPDTFFDRADEVVLVDTPADELLARLKAGKVYGAAQAERAAAHFFRKGNLMALRELALRRTADRVEHDVQSWRTDRAIRDVWKTGAAILCCVGPGPGAEQVVRGAALLARQIAVSWHAVYVETPALQRLEERRRSAILALLKLAEDLGATTAVLSGDRVATALLDHARAHNLSKIVLGRRRSRRWWPVRTLAQRLGQRASDVDLIEVGVPHPAVGSRLAARAAGSAGGSRPRVGYLAAVVACVLLTLAVLPLHGVLDNANVVMLYLLAVVGVAIRYGRGPGMLAAFVNVAAFDFCMVPPRFSLAVGDVQYLLTFAVMLAVGLIVGQLTAGLRYQARVASHREQRSRSLFEVARRLSAELVVEEVVGTAVSAIASEFHAGVQLYLLDRDDRLVRTGDGADPAGLDAGTARWAFDHDRSAGLGTDTIPGSAWLYMPLKASMRTRGVLALRPDSPRLLGVPEQRRQLETYAALVAIALERLHYVEVAGQATLQIESERLRNSILSALSHDLRTPLAGLAALAESLQLTEPPLSREQHELAGELQSSALRMNSQVVNLLDMARMESGRVRLARAWNSIEEIVGSAIRLSRRTLGDRQVTTSVPADLPLVECDAVLVERVLLNLLENAAKYTPPRSTVAVTVRAGTAEMTVAVEDDGPGIAAGQQDAIFEKFTRGVRESATAGVGLGLAICRAVVQAHGGTIVARDRSPHGASFRFTLPLTEPPGVPLDDDEDADDHPDPHLDEGDGDGDADRPGR